MRFYNEATKLNAILLFFFFTLVYTNSYSQYIFQTNTIPEKISLHGFTTVADVGEEKLNIQYVIKNYDSLNPTPLESDNEDLGFTQNYFWGKTSLENHSNVDLNYYLETARPITDRVELYVIDKKSGTILEFVSGDKMPIDKRAFDNRKTIFKLNIRPNAKLDLFFHLKSDGEVIKMPVILHSSDDFNKTESFEQFIFGIFYGILAIASIIYFFFFFALKERTFLYYSLYVFFVCFMQLSLDGYFYKYFDPSGGWLSQHCVLLFALVTLILLGKYSEVFLKIEQYNLQIYGLFYVTYLLSFILMVIIIFVPSMLVYCYPLANILGLFILVLIISSIIVLFREKATVDLFFVTGILFLIIGFVVFILNNFGLLPNIFLIQNSSKFGTGLEIIFLSLSMSNLIRNLKNEKTELNRLALVRLEEMNDLKSYFLSNISHELRTPLNAILNLIDSVSNDVIEENTINTCQIIKYSANSLLSSVNDILDFSKIEKNELKLEAKAFNPLRTLEHIKESVQLRINDKGLEFNFTKNGDFPSVVMGDEMRFSQIVNNVISNAIKFTSEGFINFDIEAQVIPDNKVRLIVSLSDSGIGIKKEKMDSIFDSFSQNSIDNKRKFGGLGLGLYIVKTLVDLQGGTIVMKSCPRKGTTCKITIDFEIVEQLKVDLVLAEPEVFDLEGKTILVVEDNSINQMVIRMITKKWMNTTVVFANNGQEGLDAFKTNTFDIVLMDLQMPIMDGYEATIAIRNGEVGLNYANIPIIAVTADVMESTKLRVAEIGMNDYLTKPIKKEALYKAIKELV
ncbi:hybrid sensor histidine kinase/response regulator [Flavobacterium cellulosilyticum]|uniref:histidine kinase n=1 Tax=Flavobacterium cellulosilyticum TaxID=2541731 RepID=A0A4R5CK65_9FLAO|nr:hybrid sensor histidine kinase/response regulator [Flavobacterium cellulosilyticum]TDD98753.1 hybrid sensor histidine kinase/response regulator [Flavobacterium cellulosilyticum]